MNVKSWVNEQLRKLLEENADIFKYTSYTVSVAKPKKSDIGKIRRCVRIYNPYKLDEVIIEGVEGVINSFFGKYNPVIERVIEDEMYGYYSKYPNYRLYILLDEHPEIEILDAKESIIILDEKINKAEKNLHDLRIERDRLEKIILQENNR